jgi:hypothetical protein
VAFARRPASNRTSDPRNSQKNEENVVPVGALDNNVGQLARASDRKGAVRTLRCLRVRTPRCPRKGGGS